MESHEGESERDVTQVLQAAAQGDSGAAAELLPMVYGELLKLGRARMARIPPGATLQPTALVHEAYVKLIGSGDPGWSNRGHFFAAAAQAMREIIVDQVRRKQRIKHGGDRQRADLDADELAIATPTDDILALDSALKRLEARDARKGQIVNLRYFAGLNVAETADALGVSVGTIEREWRFIKTWLLSELSTDSEPPQETP